MNDKNEIDRLPPGQQLVSPGKWPIIGERFPRSTNAPWNLTVTGLVEQEIHLSLEDLLAKPATNRCLDIHCVTRWSMYDVAFSGIMLAELLDEARCMETARFVSFVARSERNHSTSLTLETALANETLIATHANGQPIPVEHGGPIRNIVPGKYFYKSVKWLERIELLAEDRLGFWEAESGYHNQADPWLEQRYMAPNIDKRTAARLIESRDFSRQDLRSIDCHNRNLTGLKAEAALLRDADFRNTDLTNANFANANLSNAHFENANLRGANFENADVEGANFCGADLRGVNLKGASLIGASFFLPSDESMWSKIDSSTRIESQQLKSLTPDQHDWVAEQLNSSPR
ncbi:MAG: molybdopterin-dependent oxidoreductase [Pirellulaceae bacterium]